MSRIAIGRLAGLLTAVGGIAIMAAGSDRPPPPGFLGVMATALVVGMATAVLVPRMLGRADRVGPLRAALAAVAVGATIGAVVALVYAAVGPGEPSTPAPGLADLAVLVIVVAAAGVVAGALVAALSLSLDRFSRSGPSPDGG